MQEQTKSIFSQNENLFQQVQSQKNDKKIVKEALNQKREDFRVQVRKQQTFNQLKLKRLKFTNDNQGDQKQIDMQVFDSYIKQIIEFQVKLQQQEQSDQPNNNLVSQFVQINQILEKIRNISFNENYAQILCKNDSFLNTLVSLLQNSNIQKNHQDSTLTQFACEICWIISNLSFYSSYFPFQNINFMEQLAETVLSLLKIQSIQIKAIVLHCLSNIIPENNSMLQLFIKKNIFDLLKDIMEKKQINVEIIVSISQIINGITQPLSYQNNKDQYELLNQENFIKLVDLICLLIPQCQVEDTVLYNILKSIGNIVSQYFDQEYLQKLFRQQQILVFIFTLCEQYFNIFLVLQEISKIFISLSSLGNEELNQQLIQNNILGVLQQGIQHKEEVIRINCSVTLGNMVCISQDTIQTIIDHGILDSVLNKLYNDSMTIKKSYLQIIYNILKRGNKQQFKYILEKKIFVIFKQILQQEDPYTVILVIKCIQLFIKYGQEQASDNPQSDNIIYDQIEINNIHVLIEKLQYHKNDNVYLTCQQFIQEHFECE